MHEAFLSLHLGGVLSALAPASLRFAPVYPFPNPRRARMEKAAFETLAGNLPSSRKRLYIYGFLGQYQFFQKN